MAFGCLSGIRRPSGFHPETSSALQLSHLNSSQPSTPAVDPVSLQLLSTEKGPESDLETLAKSTQEPAFKISAAFGNRLLSQRRIRNIHTHRMPLIHNSEWVGRKGENSTLDDRMHLFFCESFMVDFRPAGSITQGNRMHLYLQLSVQTSQQATDKSTKFWLRAGYRVSLWGASGLEPQAADTASVIQKATNLIC